MFFQNNQEEERDPLFYAEEGSRNNAFSSRCTPRNKALLLGGFFLLLAGGAAGVYLTLGRNSSQDSDTDPNYEFLPGMPGASAPTAAAADTTRIVARYNSLQGHTLAKTCAQKVFQDQDDDDLIIVQANKECLKQLEKDSSIMAVELDHPVFALGSGSSSSSSSSGSSMMYEHSDAIHNHNHRHLTEVVPWGLQAIQADQLEMGPSEIVVCIVDTGIALNHPDLNKAKITGSDNVKLYEPNWSWNTEKSYHGTHVAGTIAALSDNNFGVKGAGSFRLHITRALNDNAQGFESDIRNAVQQCVDAGANIINLSLGGPMMAEISSLFYKEIVEEKGIMMIAAAGNSGNDAKVYPAAHPSVMSVGALYEWGDRWPGSNFGDQVEFAAPGHNVLSTTVSSSSVSVDGLAYHATHITGTQEASVSGAIYYAGFNTDSCAYVTAGQICLMIQDGASIQTMLECCQNGGGKGAIIFDSSNDYDIPNWIAQGITIPAVAVKISTGSLLTQKIGQSVRIGDVLDPSEVQYTYASLHGTSMASPHVAAAAALLWSHFGTCTNHQIRYALAQTAQNPNSHQCDSNVGYGLVKTKDAYDWLQANPCNTWTVPQTSQGGCTTLP